MVCRGGVILGMARNFFTKEAILMAEDTTKIHPIWKNAAVIAASQFSYGDLITFDWMHEHFKIIKPTEGNFDTFQAYQFEMLACIDGFRAEMLEEYKVALENVRGRGYRLVFPKEQTGYAETQFHKDLKRNIRKAVSLLHNIAVEALDAQDRQKNLDALGRIGSLKAMAKNQRKQLVFCASETEKTA